MARKIRSWLRRPPLPAQLIVTTHDGERKVLALATGGRRFAETEEALLALEPARVEAVDEAGVVIRVTEDFEAPEEAPGYTESSLPIVELASLIADAADKAASRHAEAYAMAFDRMVRLVDTVVGERTAYLNAYTQTQARMAELTAQAGANLAESPTGVPPELATLITMALSRMNPAATTTNGKKE